MIRRLLKDLRVLAPVGLLGALAAAVAVLWSGPAGVGILSLVAVASSVQIFGHEFTHRRMDWLLAQPLMRRALWFQKTAALAVFLVLFLSLTLAFGMLSEGIRQRGAGWDSSPHMTAPGVTLPSDPLLTLHIAIPLREYRQLPEDLYGQVLGDSLVLATLWTGRLLEEPVFSLETTKDRQVVVRSPDIRWVVSRQCRKSVPLLLFVFAAACGGLWAGLGFRQSHTAFWAALVAVVGVMLLWQLLAVRVRSGGLTPDPLLLYGVPSLIWGVCALVGSLIHIRRLEV